MQRIRDLVLLSSAIEFYSNKAYCRRCKAETNWNNKKNEAKLSKKKEKNNNNWSSSTQAASHYTPNKGWRSEKERIYNITIELTIQSRCL